MFSDLPNLIFQPTQILQGRGSIPSKDGNKSRYMVDIKKFDYNNKDNNNNYIFYPSPSNQELISLNPLIIYPLQLDQDISNNIISSSPLIFI